MEMSHLPGDDLVYRTIAQKWRETDWWDRVPYVCDKIHANRENDRMDRVWAGCLMKMDG